jgi:hypothetical protein
LRAARKSHRGRLYLTVAVNVAAWPNTDSVREELTVVLVLALLTT